MVHKHKPYTASQVRQMERRTTRYWEGGNVSAEEWQIIQDMLYELFKIKERQEKLNFNEGK